MTYQDLYDSLLHCSDRQLSQTVMIGVYDGFINEEGTYGDILSLLPLYPPEQLAETVIIEYNRKVLKVVSFVPARECDVTVSEDIPADQMILDTYRCPPDEDFISGG